MKILLTAVNAKYIHSNLAVESIKAYCNEYADILSTIEFTINTDTDFVAEEIYSLKPDVIGFSCYLWNIEIICRLISQLKKILPKLFIVLGGPEVSYEYDEFFQKGADLIVIGEGEAVWKNLCKVFSRNSRDFSHINGIAFADGNKITVTPPQKYIKLEDIPFVYKNRLDEYKNKIIYYEASRGCPYSCWYCLSSIEKGIRFLPIERVKSDLKYFLDNNVRQVKFVDRTFNCNKTFANEIWKFLIKNDNGITNFHFEISADILDNESIEILSRARTRLFQLEIGVQSVNKDTLNEIERKTNLKKLFSNVKKIMSYKNIHQHLDLIAGLPFEDYNSFENSFNEVYSLYPQQLQLGFLKLLKGSVLRRNADKYGIVYRNEAPYEVLCTNEINYETMRSLKRTEDALEIYYNSGLAVTTLKYGEYLFSSPFKMFEKIAEYKYKKYGRISHSKMNLYRIIYDMFLSLGADKTTLRNVIKFDVLLNDNIRSMPDFLKDTEETNRREMFSFFENPENINRYMYNLKEYNPKQLARMCCLSRFDIDAGAYLENRTPVKGCVFILFNYYMQNDLYNNCRYFIVRRNNQWI